MISVFAENYKCYREGDCPWPTEELEALTTEELYTIAADHKMKYMQEHYSRTTTINGILSCYTETAKDHVESVRRKSQRFLDEIKDGDSLLGEICRTEVIK